MTPNGVSPSPNCPGRIPAATYRLQFGRQCTFADARTIVPYLCELGVTDLYGSPLLQARPGSSHGYDVCDPGRLNNELGTDEAFAGLVASLHAHDLGLILDVVPNHMAADPRHNPWWRDVLTHGPTSAFAPYFDIDWRYAGGDHVVVPILGQPLPAVLAEGTLRLVFEDDAYWLAYFDHRIPVDPSRAGLDVTNPGRLIAELNCTDDTLRVARLRTLLEALPARLIDWRETARSLNYRRFFDITELVGVCVERDAVFDAMHARVLQLVREGAVTGLRIDHPDGLRDPAGYVERLHQTTRTQGTKPVYVVLEKILSAGEELPGTWRDWVHGTTGYNFLNDLNGVFVDARAASRLVASYRRVTGRRMDVADVVYEAKLLILDTTMNIELDRLSSRLRALMSGWSHVTARRVVREVIASFPVYRTYITPRGATDADIQTIRAAVAQASRRRPALRTEIAAVGRVLALTSPDHDIETVLPFVMDFQQLTGPVQAKGLEDTTSYRYPVLLSLNEVGGEPGQFARTVDTFHETNAQRRDRWPLEMLATSTHDTKRGEDARARLNALSEIPDRWDEAVRRWVAINAPLRRQVDGAPAPSLSDEYLYYQTLIGAWPSVSSLTPLPTCVSQVFVERVTSYMRKAVREAKDRTSWSDPHHDYEAAVDSFVRSSLSGPSADRFLSDFASLQRQTARLGVVNSLAQLILKIAAPGVPDFYQGTELWDFSMVDPDNRRVVDFESRRRALTRLLSSTEPEPGARGPSLERVLAGLLARSWDGVIKLFVTARGLAFRKTHRDLLVWGDYTPLEATGARTEHVVTFARRVGDRTALVVAPRLSSGITDDDHPYPLGEHAWGDTKVDVPVSAAVTSFTDMLTGARVAVRDPHHHPQVRVADVCRTLPVALLYAGPTDGQPTTLPRCARPSARRTAPYVGNSSELSG